MPRALVQMTRSDQLGLYAELAEVDNERAEDRGEAVQGSPLRPRSHHPVRSVVSPVHGQSAWDVEERLAERGVDVSYETVRRWVLKFGPVVARRLRERRPRPSFRWHL